MAKLGALEAMAELGAPKAMAGARSSGGHGGAGSSGGHGGAGSSVVFHGRGLVPRPGHSSRNPSTPPKKNSLGKLGGIRSPLGLDRQDSTWTGQGQDSPPGLNRQEQDIPQEQEALLGELGSWGFLWAWRGVRGPHRVPQQPLPLLRPRGRRLEWPPRPQQEETPAPDESPWTRQDLIKMFLWAQQDTNTALLAVTCGLDPRG